MAEFIVQNQNVTGSRLIVISAIKGNVFRVGVDLFVKFAHHKPVVVGTGKNHRDIHLHNKQFFLLFGTFILKYLLT